MICTGLSRNRRGDSSQEFTLSAVERVRNDSLALGYYHDPYVEFTRSVPRRGRVSTAVRKFGDVLHSDEGSLDRENAKGKYEDRTL